jgi:hypothetical protein
MHQERISHHNAGLDNSLDLFSMWCCSDIVALSIDGVAATLSLCQVLCLGMWLARPYHGLVLGSGVGVWCWGVVLGSGVGVWCWGLVLGSGVLRLHEAGRLHRPVWLAGTKDAVGVMLDESEACRA